MSQTAQLPFPLQFLRQFAGSLDADFSFATTAERMDYLSSPRCYPGQLIFDAQVGRPFFVNADKTGFLGLSEAIVTQQHTLSVAQNGQKEFDLSGLDIARVEEVHYYGLLLTSEQYALDQTPDGTAPRTVFRFLETRYALEAGETIVITYS